MGKFMQNMNMAPSYINLKHESMDNKKKVLTSLIQMVSLLHSHGIIYGDTFNTNMIITNSWQPFLIDFGNSFFKDAVPDIWSADIQNRLITTDVFCLQSLMGDMLDNFTHKDDKCTEISDLLETLNNC